MSTQPPDPFNSPFASWGNARILVGRVADTTAIGGPPPYQDRSGSNAFQVASRATTDYEAYAQGKVDEYRARANAAAALATMAVNDVDAFQFDAKNLRLDVANFTSPNYIVPDVGTAPRFDLPPPSANIGVLPASGIEAPAVFVSDDPKPIIGEVVISELPGGGVNPVLPQAPVVNFQRQQAPTLDVSIGSVDLPEAPQIASTVVGLRSTMAPLELDTPDVVFADLTAAVENLASKMKGLALGQNPDLDGLYDMQDFTGAMLGGGQTAWIDNVAIEPHVSEASAQASASVANLWGRRGLSVPQYGTHAAQYLTVMGQKEGAYAQASDAAAHGVSKYRQVTEAARLYVTAYSAVTDLQLAVFDLGMRRALLLQGVSVLQLTIAAAQAEAYALAARVGAANARAKGQAAAAKAQGYKDEARVIQSQVDLNRAVARQFKAVQDAKGVQAQVYGAQLSVEKAKLEAFLTGASVNADMDTAEASFVSARIRAEVAQYLGQLAQIEGDYSATAAEARAVSQRNRALASKVRAEGDIIGTGAAKTSAEVSRISAMVASIESRIQDKAGAYLSSELQNAIASSLVRTQTLSYQADVLQNGLEQEAEATRMEGQEQEFRAAARHFVALSEAAMRAAQLCQQINIQAAEAEAKLKESVGQAKAAIESGRLSGYRASVSYDADRRMAASRRVGVSVSEAANHSSNESDSLTIEPDAFP